MINKKIRLKSVPHFVSVSDFTSKISALGKGPVTKSFSLPSTFN